MVLCYSIFAWVENFSASPWVGVCGCAADHSFVVLIIFNSELKSDLSEKEELEDIVSPMNVLKKYRALNLI